MKRGSFDASWEPEGEEEAQGTFNDPPKKRKAPGRVRAACASCRQNKQKCDAQTTYPCRRCQLYGLQCNLDAAAPRDSSKAPAPAASSNKSSSIGGDRLQEIADRLGRIETAFAATGGWHSPQASPPLPILVDGYNGDGPKRPRTDLIAQYGDAGALQHVRSVTADYGVIADNAEDEQWTVDDAVARGIINEQESADLVQFYFEHLEGSTVPITTHEEDGDHVRLRKSSPLLYHAILITSAYYMMLGTVEGRTAYQALSRLVSEQLGPAILFARLDTHYLSMSTLRAFMLLVVRTPLTPANMPASAIPLKKQCLSKLDLTSAALLLQLAIKMAYLLNLRQKAMTILDAEKTPNPSPADLVICRVWFLVCQVEAHGCMQAGRLPTTTPVDHESMLDRYVLLSRSKADVMQACFLALTRLGRDARWSLFELTRQKAGCVHHAKDLSYLQSYRAEHIRWREIWLPRIGNDALWHIVPRFVHLSLLSRYVSTWADELRFDGMHNPYAEFSPAQRDIVREAIESALEGTYGMSVESRASNIVSGRHSNWSYLPPESRYGVNTPRVARLTPDADMVVAVSRAIDTINCVVVPYFALFLLSQHGKASHFLAALSLELIPLQTMNCDLRLMSADEMLATRGFCAILPESRLRRLVDLVADTLELAAPTATHPAVGHANMLRRMIDQLLVREGTNTSDMSCLVAADSVSSSGSTSSAYAAADLFAPSHQSSTASAPILRVPSMGDRPIDYSAFFASGLDWNSKTVDWSTLGTDLAGYVDL